MGEHDSSFELLRRASARELFHLQNGLDVTTIRELVVQLRLMDEKTFRHHVTADRNDFATWVRDVFHDHELAEKISSVHEKKQLAKVIEDHLISLEEKELERFGVHLPSNDLFLLEEYIEKQERLGRNEEHIRETLLRKGWSKTIVELVLAGRKNPYKEYHSLEVMKNIDHFYHVLEELKRKIINAVSEGSTVDDIKKFLRKVGWDEKMIEFILYDIFQPHPNLKKLAHYIIHQVKDKKKDVEETKADLLKLGWKEYIIDSVIYGINTPNNSLMKILSYLDEFSDAKNHEQVKAFLLQMGWNELDVNEAIRQKELEEVQERIARSFNVDHGEEIKEKSELINEHVVRLFDHEQLLWKKMLSGYEHKSFSELQQSNGELHITNEYTYFYSFDDIRVVEELEKKKVHSVWVKEATMPLLIELKHHYLITPRIIQRPCAVCGKTFLVTKMKKVEMWDAHRTHKIVKFVCLEHAKQMENFLEETKIVQS